MSLNSALLIPDTARYAMADRAKHSAGNGLLVELPWLSCWNDLPCRDHNELTMGCPHCGIRLRRHQQSGAAWLWLNFRGLLADQVGLGKTGTVAAVLAMCRESGEIGDATRRTIIIARAAAVGQWQRELRRMIRGLQVSTATGTIGERVSKYLEPWDVMVISPQMLVNPQGGDDKERLALFHPHCVIYDDTDGMRDRDNKTAVAIKKLAETAQRVIGVHATPLQKKLTELHSFLEPVGGREVFGPQSLFRHNFVTSTPVSYTTHDRTGREVVKSKVIDIGIKNPAEFRRLLGPLVLRRTAAELTDVTLPAIQPATVWLDPTPQQRARYAELRKGVLRMIREQGDSLTRPAAMARFTRGAQICSGLAALDSESRTAISDGPGSSAKLDWLEHKLTGDLADEKVVVFIHFTPNLLAMSERLKRNNIGHALIWGGEPSQKVRAQRLRAFQEDPDCKVLMGTTSIEASLNLQVARHMVLVDTIINPARMEQLAGRVRRVGSFWETVYIHHLLLTGTQEDRYPDVLSREQNLIDMTWDEESELFPSLTARQLVELIAA